MSGERSRAREEVSAGGVVFRVVSDGGAPRALFLLIRDSYRNWGFPKGHLETGEVPEGAAVREVGEETGLVTLHVQGAIDTIDWYFRFRGRLIHKVCHFFLMQTDSVSTCPQRAEGITACRWAPFDEAVQLVSYANARDVLRRAHVMVSDVLRLPEPAGAPAAGPASVSTEGACAGGACADAAVVDDALPPRAPFADTAPPGPA